MAKKVCFKKGALVEANLEEEGFRGSWYTAKVLRTVTDKKTKKKLLYLEYDNLISEDGSTDRLCEYVDEVLVRPAPPRETDRSFNLSEEVDVFHNDGWWEGVVTSVLEDSRYAVFFRTSREQLQFHRSDLRLHREWIHGEWVPPLEQQ